MQKDVEITGALYTMKLQALKKSDLLSLAL
jgi:hypothetical protein